MAGADGSIQADAARARLEALRAALNGELRRLLLALDTERGDPTLSKDRQALATATRVRQQVMAILEERGATVVDEAERAVAAAAAAVAKDVQMGAFEPDAVRTLQEIVSGQSDEVLQTFKVGRARIGEAMRVAISTQAELGELLDQVAREIDTTFLKAQAAVDAAVMGAGRAVTLRAGDDAAGEAGEPIVYRFVGPNDAKTRPFCRSIVGKCFTRGAMRQLDNGTDMPADLFGGSYNCRHSWAPLLMSDAVDAGYEVVT